MSDFAGFSEYTRSSLEILRKPQLTMHWYVIPIFLLVLYIVTKELNEKHYKVLWGGAALWVVDLFNEIWNSMVCFISDYAPVWGVPQTTPNRTACRRTIPDRSWRRFSSSWASRIPAHWRQSPTRR